MRLLSAGFCFAVWLLAATDSGDARRPCAEPADCAKVSSEIDRRTGYALNLELPRGVGTPPVLPPGVTLEPELTEEEAVAIALWNNASLHAALADLGVARSELIDAGLLRNPRFQVLFPVGPKPFESVLEAPVEILWQRPRRVAAAKMNLEAAGYSLVQHGLDLVREVRAGHAQLALAERQAAIAQEAAALRQKIAELTEKRLQAGDISAMEAGVTRTDARLAEDEAGRFLQDAAAARERLRLLLGLRNDRSSWRAKPLAAEARTLPEWPGMVETALASRPDLRAAELALESALQRARWERSRVLALLAPLLSVKEVGPPGTRAGPGFTIELPFFHRNQAGISRADAEVRRATLRYAALRDQVELEIREASIYYAQATESLLRVRNRILPEVTKSIELAERAYAGGDVSYLFVLETSRQLYDVRLREAEAMAGVRRALVQLERSMGTKL